MYEQEQLRKGAMSPPSKAATNPVQVHYNSDKPQQINASSYTQGNQIYLGKGREQDLSHELGHALQQQRSKVPATERINGMNANTDTHLEHEADRLGENLSGKMDFSVSDSAAHGDTAATQAAPTAAPIQMMRTPAQWWRDRQAKKMQSRRDNAQISAPMNKAENKEMLLNSGNYSSGDLMDHDLIMQNRAVYGEGSLGPSAEEIQAMMRSFYEI